MTKIAFIGLGNMGGGMAANQAKAGHAVAAFDLSAQALERAVTAGCVAAGSVAEAVKNAEVVITMLPADLARPATLRAVSTSMVEQSSSRAVDGAAPMICSE